MVLVVSTLSACSSSGKSSGGSPSSGSPKSVSGAPVEVVIPYSGTGIASYPENTVAIQAAERAINDSGGINGHPLNVLPCDQQNPLNPNIIKICMQKAISNKDVVASVGDWTAFNDVTTPLENQAHMAQIGGVPLGASQGTLPNSFPLVMLESEGFGAALVAEGAKKPGLAYIDLPSTANTFSSLNAYLKAAGSSVQFGQKVPVSPTSTDLTPEVATLCSSDAVALALSATEIQQYLTAHEQSPCADQKLITTSLGIAQTVANLGALGNGLLTASGLPFPTDTSFKGIEMFNQQMEAIDPSARRDVPAEVVWMSIWAFALEARKMSGAITRASVLAHWQGVSTIQVFDLLPPGLNLKDRSPVAGSERIASHWIRLGAVQNGVINDTGKGWIDVLKGS
jgi:hypothetical protein